MTTPSQVGEDPVERLALQLDRYASGDRSPSDPILDELRRPSTWDGPPSELRGLILDRITPRPTPAVVAKPARSWRARLPRLAWAVPAAALAAALFTGGVLAAERALQPGPPASAVYSVGGTTAAPDATATVTIEPTGAGFVIVLTIEDLPAAAEGSYYAAWLRGPDGTVPIGSFHQRRTGIPVRLWSGVDPARYPTLLVTLQAEGGPPGPSTVVVLTGTLDR